MTKSLKQIQEENRKAILRATLPESIASYLHLEDAFSGATLDLARVLRALDSALYDVSTEDSSLCFWTYKFDDCEPVEEIHVDWGLTKSTLEEQSEETQRAINELLIDTSKPEK